MLPRQLCLYLCLCSLPVYASPTPELKIEGGASELRENIRQYLSIANEHCSAPLWRLKALLIDGDEEIEQAAQALGYYQLTFTTKLTKAHDCWQLSIQLTPGEQVTITEVQIDIEGEGAQDDIFSPILTKPDVALGDKLNHGRYENIKNRIQTMATGHGYFDGHFQTANIIVNTADNTAHIVIVYNTGVRYRLGDIHITHDILSDEFLTRYLNIESGDYYDTDKLLELKNLYNATNYFNVATASPDLQQVENKQVPIDIVLEKRKRREYTVGYGVSTDTGPRALLGYEDRYLNNNGHTLKGDLSSSTIKTNAQVTYNIPMDRPSYEFLRFIPAYEKENTDTTYSIKKSFAASYTYYQKSQWLHTYAISSEWEQSRIGDDPLRNTHLLIPSVTFSRTRTDGTPYPLSGWNLQARLSGSPTTLGSDVSFIQENIRAKYIYSIFGGRLLARTEVGVTQVNDVQSLPISVRYFAGGDTSVRGYDYKALGSKNQKGDVLGGSHLWVNSLEYDHRIKPNWALAAFYDVGNAGNDFHFALARGTGVGVRWISPIGPVRIDVAKALDENKGWSLHVSMGPDL